MGKVKQFVSQFKVLGKKNFILSYRNYKSTLAQLASPVAVVILLLFFQIIGDVVKDNKTVINPPPSKVGGILQKSLKNIELKTDKN